MDETNYLQDRFKRAKEENAKEKEAWYQVAAPAQNLEARDQFVASQITSQAGDDYLSQRFAKAKAENTVQQRQQQRAMVDQAPPEMVKKTEDILRYISNYSNRFGSMEAFNKLSDEEKQMVRQLAPGVMQRLGADRGNPLSRLVNAAWKGTNEMLINPTAELSGQLTGYGFGLSQEDIEIAREFEGLRSQEAGPSREDDPWYERGVLGAAEMAPWSVSVAAGGGIGGGIGRAGANLLARKGAELGGRSAAFAKLASQAAQAPTKVGLPAVSAEAIGSVAGVTASAFPASYSQEYHELKEMGIEDGVGLRTIAATTATAVGMIESLIPNPFPGKVKLNRGVVNAVRQHFYEAAKKAPVELSEEYFQGVTSGVGQAVASYLYENAEDKNLADAFAKGWEEMSEAALPMAFLMGVPAVAAGGRAGISARKQTADFQKMADKLTPEQSAQAIQRMIQLQSAKSSKPFISREDAQRLGIEGDSRRERMANLNEELDELKYLSSRAARMGQSSFTRETGRDAVSSAPVVKQTPEGVLDEIREQGQQDEQGQAGQASSQIREEGELRSQEEVDQIAFDAASDPEVQAEPESAKQTPQTEEDAAQAPQQAEDPRPADGDFEALAEWADRQAEMYEQSGRPENAIAARLQAQQFRNEAQLDGKSQVDKKRQDDAIKAKMEDRKKQQQEPAAGLKGQLGPLGGSSTETPKSEQEKSEQPAAPLIGQFIQWTSNNVDQFKEPKKVVGSETKDGVEYLQIEGESTWIPASEAKVASIKVAESPDIQAAVDDAAAQERKSWEAATESQAEATGPPVVKTADEIESIPKHSVYQGEFKGRRRFMVRGDGRQGFGDSIFDTQAEAEREAKLAVAREKEEGERREKAAEKKKADEKAEADYVLSFQGFDSENPMKFGKARKALEKQVNYKGEAQTRKQVIEKAVAKGATVREVIEKTPLTNNRRKALQQERLNERKSGETPRFKELTTILERGYEEKPVKRLTFKDGSFLSENAISATGMRYAEHLNSKKPASDEAKAEPTKPELKESDEPTSDRDKAVARLKKDHGFEVVPREPVNDSEREQAEFLTSRGKKFAFVDSSDVRFRGTVDPRTGFILIAGNRNASDIWHTIGHELAHETGLDKIIPADSAELAKWRKKRLDNATSSYRKMLEADSALLDREARADMVGAFLRDKAFRDQLARENPTMWEALRDAILKLLGKWTPKNAAQAKVLEELRQKPSSAKQSSDSQSAPVGKPETEAKSKSKPAEQPAGDAVDEALKALDAILAQDDKPKPPKSIRKTPEVTKQGQLVLPILPGMAKEIDRQDFVRRFRDRALDGLWSWSNDFRDKKDIQETIDLLAPLYDKLFNEIYKRSINDLDSAWDSSAYTEIKEQAELSAVGDSLILEELDKQINESFKEQPKQPAEKKPRKSDQTLAEAKSDLQAAHDAMTRLMQKHRSKLMSGIDPGLMAETVQVAYLYAKAGVKTFKGYVERVVEQFGDAFAREIAIYMEAGWAALNIRGVVEDATWSPDTRVADYLSEQKAIDYGTADSPNRIELGKYFAKQLGEGRIYDRITQARNEASELIGESIEAGTQAAKDIDEAVEQGVVRVARDIVAGSGTEIEKFDKLLDLYNRQPRLAVRTGSSMKEQAYSTPAPLAYLVSVLTDTKPGMTVYDSSAGNGMLLIATQPENGIANEINKDRAAALKAIGHQVNQGDGTQFTPEVTPDRVIINPPFGQDGDMTWTIDGTKTDLIDHAISMKSLSVMPDNGKAVLILGAKGFENREPKAEIERGNAYKNQKNFYDQVYDNYNVTDHFTVHGDMYAKQGASFPVDVIIINGRGKSQLPKPYQINHENAVPRVINSWEELRDAAKRHLDTGNGRPGDISTELKPGVIPGIQELLEGQNQGTGKDGKRSGKRNKRRDTVSPERESADQQTRGTDRQSDFLERGDGATQSEAEQVSNDGQGDEAGRGAGDTARVDGPSTEPITGDAETAFQVTYKKRSRMKGVGTLVPKTQADAVERALQAAEDRYGDLDEFVAKELGYELQDIIDNEYFSAEQMDALALNIARHKEGKAFVLGDQTGVGKGRVAAGMMVYARKQGLVPVFMTQSPMLYKDMYRDLINIGQHTDQNPFNALATNTLERNEAIELPDGTKIQQSSAFAKSAIEKLADAVESGVGTAIPIVETVTVDEDGNPLGVTKSGRQKTRKVKSSRKYDAVFTTYSQMSTQRGVLKERHTALQRIAPHAFFILDESHNAAGSGDQQQTAAAGKVSAAMMIRGFLDVAQGASFLSATYAKRVQVMDVYARTGITDAIAGGADALINVLVKGGVPLQQVLSEMLVESGAYMRRERSFDGVSFDIKVTGQGDRYFRRTKRRRRGKDSFKNRRATGREWVKSGKRQDTAIKYADAAASLFNAINDFDQFKNSLIESTEFQEWMVSSGLATGKDVATGNAGAESTTFSSIMHNLVDQMLLSIKAEDTALEAIESLKRGESPVIALSSTMGAALNHYLEANPASIGDEIDFRFSTMASRYLERSRDVLLFEKLPDGTKVGTQLRLPDSLLGDRGLAIYNAAQKLIDNFSADLPASPIDHIRNRIEQSGYRVAEITGRELAIDYAGDSMRLSVRPADELSDSGKIRTVSRFNSGDIDVIILNQSGSTGLSIHAAPEFSNTKRRHMIIAQADKNIDTFMQMLGRIHRTGQIEEHPGKPKGSNKPKYSLLISSVPAETRPAAVLVKKLSSLNANVTADSKGSVSFDVPDIFNSIGDRIVAEYLAENPELNNLLEPDGLVNVRTDGTPEVIAGIASKASGRMARRPVVEQQRFWESVSKAFNDEITSLDALGKNPLQASRLDLGAEILERVQIFDGDPEADSPFMQPAFAERARVKKQGKPHTPKEIRDALASVYGKQPLQGDLLDWSNEQDALIDTDAEATVEARIGRLKDPLPNEIADIHTEMRLRVNSVKGAVYRFAPGKIVYVSEGDNAESAVTGVVIGLTPSKGRSHTLSGWTATISVASPDRVIRVPLTRVDRSSESSDPSDLNVQSTGSIINDNELKEWEIGTDTYEERILGTGNILAAFDQLTSGNDRINGSIVFFTDNEGKTQRGVLMSRSFNLDRWKEQRPAIFATAEQVLQFINISENYQVQSPNFEVQLTMDGDTLVIRAPISRQRSGKYTTNPEIIRASGTDFVSVGQVMQMKVKSRGAQKAVIEAILKVGPLSTGLNKDVARRIIDPSSGTSPSSSQVAELRSKLNDVGDVLYQREDAEQQFYDQAADIALDALDAGIDSYDQFMELAAETLGERRAWLLGAYLQAAAESVGMTGVKSFKDVLKRPEPTRSQVKTMLGSFRSVMSEEMLETGQAVIDAIGFHNLPGGVTEFAPAGAQVPGGSLAQSSLWDVPSQQFTSEDTSINQNRLPASFSKIDWKSGTVNADIGGGRFDNATEMLAGRGVENVIYDPFNRSQEHNRRAVEKIAGGRADTATVNNVLNVIKEPAARMQVIRQAADAVGPDGVAYFLIYEGDSSGNSRATSKGWQENRKAETYIREIESVFGKVTRKGSMLIASDAIGQAAADQTQAPAFKKWFGDSKVVDYDKNDAPLVVYHGTRRGFDTFSEDEIGSANDAGFAGKGFYFSSSPSTASDYANGGVVMPVYLSIQNPKIADSYEDIGIPLGNTSRDKAEEIQQTLRSQGYDGIIIRGSRGDADEFVAFSPTQIKSATGNQGTFDPNNPSILAQNQEQGGNVKGWTHFVSATRAIIGATDKADFSTFIHELFHPIRKFLLNREIPVDKRQGITDEELTAFEEYAGAENGVWTVAAEEKAAKAWEQYWLEGWTDKLPVALKSLFEKIARWMLNVYNGTTEITGGQLPPQVRALFDKIVQRGYPQGIASPALYNGVGAAPPSSPSHPENIQRVSPNRHEFTSIAKQVKNELRAIAGLPGMETLNKEKVAEWVEQAELALAVDPDAALRLYRSLASNRGRAIDHHEATLLAFHYRKLANDAEVARRESEEAAESGDAERIAAARSEFARVRQPMTEFEEMTYDSLSTWGRTGVAIQIMLRNDYTLEGLMRRARHANHGKPLTDAERKKYEELAEKHKKLQEELDKMRAKEDRKQADRDSQRQHDDAVKNTPQRPIVKPNDSQKAMLDQRWGEWSDVVGVSTLFQGPDVYQGVVQGYRDIGVKTFAELMRHVLERLGDSKARQFRKQFREAWRATKPDSDVQEVIDVDNAAEMTRLARRIQRELIESGMRDRNEVIDAVREEMSSVLGQEITRIQAMDALSRYGQYSVPSQDEIEAAIRHMNAETLKARQILQLQEALTRAEELRAMNPELTEQQIGDQLVREGLMVKPTGPQRDQAWPDFRTLTRQYNDLKSQVPISTDGRAGMLQSTLGAIERRLRNRIADLQKAIADETPISSGRKQSPTSPRIEELRQEAAELTAAYRELFPPKRVPLTEEQRIRNAIRAAERSIKSMEQQIATHNFDKPKSVKVSSPELEALNAQRQAMRTHIAALKEFQRQQWEGEGGALEQDRHEIAMRKAYLASIENRIAEYRRRIAEGDFAPKKRPVRQLSPEEVQAQLRLREVKQEAMAAMAKQHLQNLSLTGKALDAVTEFAHLSRAMMTSMDLSAMLNQGATVALGRPSIALKTMLEAGGSLWRSFSREDAFNRKNLTVTKLEQFFTGIDSQKAELEFMHKLNSGEVAEFWKKAGLHITEADNVTKQEEFFQGRWAKYFPGVSGSGRVYTMMLNKMRRDMADLLVTYLPSGASPTLEEGKLIAHFVNVATGRSDLKDVPWLKHLESQSLLLNAVFFAPRFVISRFQYLAMPFYLPVAGGGLAKNWQLKRAILVEWTRSMGGLALVLGAISMSGVLFYEDDDDEKPTIGLDPTSSDFLKAKIGETRVDFAGGIMQAVVLASRLQQQRIGDNEFGSGFNRQNYATVIAKFLRTKLAPVPGYVVTGLNNWEDPVGNVDDEIFGYKVHPSIATGRRLVIPLSGNDVVDSLREHGAHPGMMMAILAILGARVSTYGPKSKYLDADDTEKEELFNQFLRKMSWNTPDPAYSEFLNREQYQMVTDRRENRKQAIVVEALSEPDPKSFKDPEDYQKAIAKRDAAIKVVRQAGWTTEEIRRMVIEYWRINHGSPRQLRGGVYTLKDAVRSRIRRIERIFGGVGQLAE